MAFRTRKATTERAIAESQRQFSLSGDAWNKSPGANASTTNQNGSIDANAYFIYGPNGLPVEEIYAPSSSSTGASTSTVLYYLQDALGSTRALVTSSDNIAASYSYTPYGTLRCTSAGIGAGIPGIGMPPHSCGMPPVNPPRRGSPPCRSTVNDHGLQLPATHGHIQSCITQAVSVNPFLFAGQFFDSTSGLYYMRARWYDPATGQFLSVDPLVATTNQPYQYAGDNPVSNTDPTGQCECVSASTAYNTLKAAALPSLFDLLVITPGLAYVGGIADELALEGVLGVFPLAAPGIIGVASISLAGLAAIALTNICPA